MSPSFFTDRESRDFYPPGSSLRTFVPPPTEPARPSKARRGKSNEAKKRPPVKSLAERATLRKFRELKAQADQPFRQKLEQLRVDHEMEALLKLAGTPLDVEDAARELATAKRKRPRLSALGPRGKKRRAGRLTKLKSRQPSQTAVTRLRDMSPSSLLASGHLVAQLPDGVYERGAGKLHIQRAKAARAIGQARQTERALLASASRQRTRSLIASASTTPRPPVPGGDPIVGLVDLLAEAARRRGR